MRARIASLNTAAQHAIVKSGCQAPFSLAFLTDATRIPVPEIILRQLPPGVAVIYRDYHAPNRQAVAQRLKAICADRQLLFLIGGDVNIARLVQADGVHCPSWMTPDKRALDGFIVTAACHGPLDLKRAAHFGADLAFLSPVFPTGSHPGAAHLGAHQFKKTAATAPDPDFGTWRH